MSKKYTVKDLKKMISKAKKENKTCASFSKMKRAELVEHARSLGLIDTPNDKKNMLVKQLRELNEKAQKVKSTSQNIKKKKDSLLRRIGRFIADKDELTNDMLKAGLTRLKADYKKIINMSVKPTAKNILF